MQMTDHLVEDGYKDAGYEYVSIDVSNTVYRFIVLQSPFTPDTAKSKIDKFSKITH